MIFVFHSDTRLKLRLRLRLQEPFILSYVIKTTITTSGTVYTFLCGAYYKRFFWEKGPVTFIHLKYTVKSGLPLNRKHNLLQNYRFQVVTSILWQTSIAFAFMNSLESPGGRFCETYPWMTRPLEIWKRITSTVKLLKSATKGSWNGQILLAPRKRRLKNCASLYRKLAA